MSQTDPSRQLRFDAAQFIRETVYPAVGWPWFEEVLESWLAGRFNADPKSCFSDTLPGLIGMALGGEENRCTPLVAAWLLYIVGAKVLDDVQDQDAADQLWMRGGLDCAIPLGMALITAPNICLAHLDTDGETLKAILVTFGQVATSAARGQSRPTDDFSSLETYFSHIVSTTAQLFAAGAWAGGRLLTKDEGTLTALSEFGHGLGMKTAIMLDCLDLNPSNEAKPSDLAVNSYKLPVIYAAATCKDHPQHEKLMALLDLSQPNEDEVAQMIAILDHMRAVTWSVSLAEQFQVQALQALDRLPAVKQMVSAYV